MNVKLVDNRSRNLRASDMRIGEVFYISGRGFYMRIDPNPGNLTILGKNGVLNDVEPVWIIALNKNSDHTLGYLPSDTHVISTHGMLSIDLP